MSGGVFRSGTVLTLVLVGGTSFLLALFFAVFGPDLAPQRSTDPDAYSYSAIGHRGLVDALRRAGIPVLISRRDSAARARNEGILVLAEPTHHDTVGEDGRNPLRRQVDHGEFTLLVLPKRSGGYDPKRPTWVRWTHEVGQETAEAVLEAAGIEANVRRIPAGEVEPIASRVGASPTFLEGDVQVVEGPGLTPVVTTAGGGAILAHVGTHPGLYVLADPDPLANAGFHRGENAAFFVGTLQHIRDGFQLVVFDETVHGHGSTPTIWRELFHFPLVLVVIHLALVVAVLLWTAMGRFGRPEKAAAPLQPGRAFLVDRSAELLQSGGRTAQALPRYLDVVLRDVRGTLDLPLTLRDEALDAGLDRIAESRRVEDRVEDLRQAVHRAAGTRVQAHLVAQRIHRWRTEILHGTQ